MKYYNSDLGVELPERSYAEACEVTYDNIMVPYKYDILWRSLIVSV